MSEKTHMLELPQAFIDRMKKMLGEEFSEFFLSYEQPRLRGLRVNTMKIRPEEFEAIAPFPVKRIPWVKNGFFYDNDTYPARHPYYAAGLYYLQEPSAMTPASRLEIAPGDRVLDLCAAPGGKATELAAKLDGTGILVANDASNSRAKALLRNLELFGTKNMLVTNEMPDRLSEAFPSYFHKILVDAPCSGEGMFRKAPEVAETWSPERVAYFSKQQRNILENAWKMLCPGGMLMYSTCTFSPEEDEQMIAWFLREYPDMELVEMEDYAGFAPGRPEWADGNEELRKCVRIWPHRMNGEGHFLALLHKKAVGGSDAAEAETTVSEMNHVVAATDGVWADDAIRQAMRESGKRAKKSKKAGKQRTGQRENSGSGAESYAALFDAFFEGCGEEQLRFSQIEQRGEKAYLSPTLPPGVRGMNFLRNGLYVGEWKKKRFEPSQPLAMTLTPEKYPRCFCLEPEDPRVAQYLRGETITLQEGEQAENGWNLICVKSYPLGWGKVAGQTIKNKYLSSWRSN